MGDEGWGMRGTMQCSSRTMYCHPERCTVIPNDVLSSRAKRGIWAPLRTATARASASRCARTRSLASLGMTRASDARLPSGEALNLPSAVPPSPILHPPSPSPALSRNPRHDSRNRTVLPSDDIPERVQVRLQLGDIVLQAPDLVRGIVERLRDGCLRARVAAGGAEQCGARNEE